MDSRCLRDLKLEGLSRQLRVYMDILSIKARQPVKSVPQLTVRHFSLSMSCNKLRRLILSRADFSLCLSAQLFIFCLHFSRGLWLGRAGCYYRVSLVEFTWPTGTTFCPWGRGIFKRLSKHKSRRMVAFNQRDSEHDTSERDFDWLFGMDPIARLCRAEPSRAKVFGMMRRNRCGVRYTVAVVIWTTAGRVGVERR